MKRGLLILALTLAAAPPAAAGDCPALLAELGLPAKLKTGGKPRVAKWGEVERVMTLVRGGLLGRDCRFTFGELFVPNKRESFFPLIGNVLRTVPEDSLEGVGVFNQSGEPLGDFANRVVFEKRGEYNYTDYYFQFRDANGKLQSSGNRLLVDIATGRPLFLIKWDEIENRTAAVGR